MAEAMGADRVSPGEFGVLVLIEANSGINQTALAAAVGADRSTMVPILDRLYDFHSFEVIPRLGQIAAGDADSYRYLVESIRKFPSQERFADMVREAGFARVGYRNLAGGIAAIHSGWKI